MKSAVLANAAGALLVTAACTEMPSRPATAHGDSTEACATSPGGVELWQHGLGDVDVSVWTSVAVDPQGDAFVAIPPVGTIKIDSRGNIEWAKSFGALVAVGPNGHVHVAGSFAETAAPEGCAVTANGDAYVAELDPDGTFLRCSSIGASSEEGLSGLTIDNQGSAVVSGPGLGTIKIDDQGRVAWRQELAGRVATDSRDNVLVAGALSGSALFGEEVIASKGGDDVLLAKLNPTGNFLYVHRFGDAGGAQRAEGIAVDSSDNVLVSGVSDGTVDFGGGPITAAPERCPNEVWCAQAGFVAKFDPAGRHLWSRSRFPVRSLPGIAANSSDNVLVSGAFPGNTLPYRLPLLVEFDSAGNSVERTIPTTSNSTDSGTGYGVAFDVCDNVLWAHAAPLVPSAKVQSFLAKLAP